MFLLVLFLQYRRTVYSRQYFSFFFIYTVHIISIIESITLITIIYDWFQSESCIMHLKMIQDLVFNIYKVHYKLKRVLIYSMETLKIDVYKRTKLNLQKDKFYTFSWQRIAFNSNVQMSKG